MCNLINLAHIVVHNVKHEMRGEKRCSQLTQLQLAAKTTYDVLRDATPRSLDALDVESTAKLMDDFALRNSYNGTVVESTTSNDNNELIKPIICKMNTWLPRFTSDL